MALAASTEGVLHDSDARNDAKCVALRMRCGSAGYGIYWMLIEQLRTASGYRLVNDAATLAFAINESAEVVAKVLSVMLDEDVALLKTDGKYIWSESLIRRIEAYEAVKAARAKGGREAHLKGRTAEAENVTTDNLKDSSADTQGTLKGGDKASNPNITQPNLTKDKGREGVGGKPSRLHTPYQLLHFAVASQWDKLKGQFGEDCLREYLDLIGAHLDASGQPDKANVDYFSLWILKDRSAKKNYFSPEAQREREQQNRAAKTKAVEKAALKRRKEEFSKAEQLPKPDPVKVSEILEAKGFKKSGGKS